MRKQPFQLLLLPAKGVNDIDRALATIFAFRSSWHSCSLMLSGKLGKNQEEHEISLFIKSMGTDSAVAMNLRHLLLDLQGDCDSTSTRFATIKPRHDRNPGSGLL